MNETILFSHRSHELYYHHTVTSHPDPDKFPFRLHSHNMHELYYFVGGEGEYTVEGSTYALSKGTMIFSPGGQVHHLNVRSGQAPYERIVFMFGMSLLPPSLESLLHAAERGGRVFRLGEREQIFFEEGCLAIENGDLGEEEKEEAVRSLLRVILTKLCGLSHASEPVEEPENETVREIVRFINRNLTSPLCLDLLEKEFFRDKATLNRCFKQVMGCSIWEYVIRKRIFNARQVLYQTENVASAFSASGFGDYSVFYRNYVRVAGCSPTADLRQMRKED